MTIEDLYDLADSDDIIIEHQLIGCPALSVNYGQGAICVDPSLIDGETKFKCILAHELGHCETMSFYTKHSPYVLKSQMERKADIWAIKKLLPKEELVKCKGMRIWEIAERFDVTEDLVRLAIDYYK